MNTYEAITEYLKQENPQLAIIIPLLTLPFYGYEIRICGPSQYVSLYVYFKDTTITILNNTNTDITMLDLTNPNVIEQLQQTINEVFHKLPL